jgi:hypothetical protein
MLRKEDRGRPQHDRQKTHKTPHFDPHKELYPAF